MNMIDAEGTVRAQGVTSYMYGTHVLVDERGETLYALTGDRPDLDTYVDTYVRVSGSLVPGYPLEGGPELLNVADVQRLQRPS